jgi:ABC-type transporter Mla subunit MlaD
MALQDLTPQLRTRLSRMERAVGWFVLLAVLLLAFGFVYYVYTTAENKGWFKTKAPFFTLVRRATGLKVGDPVQLLGFPAGQITEIEPQPPGDQYDVFVKFEIKAPYIGYLWTDGSVAKINAADLLGKRVLEVTKGETGYPTFVSFPLRTVSLDEAGTLAGVGKWEFAQEIFDRNKSRLFTAREPVHNLPAVAAAGYTTIRIMNAGEKGRALTGMWNEDTLRYDPYTNGVSKFWLRAQESPAVTDQLQALVTEVQNALPNIFNLTNELYRVLTNSESLTSNLNAVAVTAKPAVSNLAAATANLNHPGALGEWLFPTNIARELETTLGTANVTLTNANTNLAALVENLSRSLDNLAGITSNLNAQVQANTNLVSAISETIIHADQFIQGLKHHWLLRSAFKEKKPPAPPPARTTPLKAPKEKGLR